MTKISTTAALALGTATLTAAAPQYTRIPFGRSVLSHCVHEVASGAVSSPLEDGRTRVEAPDGTVTIIPQCEGGEVS